MSEPGIEIDSIAHLVERWQAGEDCEASFRRLFEIHYRPVYRFFEKRGFASDESHDLTQETFVRVYNGIGTFRRDAPFEAWLFQIAANVYRNALRHRKAKKRAGQHLSLVGHEDDEAAQTETEHLTNGASQSPLDEVLQAERLRVLRAAIESLPEQMRKCVMLRAYQDLSYQEIAVVMRLSAETVKAHLFQARRQLKAKLTARFDEQRRSTIKGES